VEFRKRKGIRARGLTAIAVVAAVLVVAAGVAFADQLQSDSDALTAGVDNSAATLTLAPGTSTVTPLSVGAQIKDTGSTDVTFPVSVTVTEGQDLNNILTLGSPSGTTITAYGNAGEVSVPVTVTAPSSGLTCGANNQFMGKVRFEAPGVSDTLLSDNPNDVIISLTVPGPACTQTNTPPTVNAGGPYSGGEGSDISLNGTATDNDTLDLTWTYALQGTWEGTPTCAFSDVKAEDPTISCNDDGSVKVTLTADDGVNAPVSADATVTVTNVAPTASNGSFTYNNYTGAATASFDFADDGTNDTHSPAFSWAGATSGDVETDGAGTATSTKTLTPGCYSLTVTGKTTDDEGADSNTLTLANAVQIDIYTAKFLPPIKDDERNFAKYGNVLPVKVQFTSSCTHLPVAPGPDLFLTYAKGTADTILGDEVVATSVSSADGTGGQMRIADGFYIYNFTTKPLTCNTDYSLRVYMGSTLILDATLSLKK
jgi:hypothetical protein